MNRLPGERPFEDSFENDPHSEQDRSEQDRFDRAGESSGGRGDAADSAARLRRAQIVEYIDGAMSVAAARVFEATLRESPALAREVERARCLRALVSTLPRIAAPESVRRYTATLASLPRAASTQNATPEQLLLALPRRVAPVGLRDSVLAAIRRERVVVEVARERRAFRPSFRTWAPMAVAAAVLVGVTTWLFESREVVTPRRAGARTFVFEVSTLRPGEQTSGFRSSGVPRTDASVRRDISGGGRSSIDPTLVPPSFAASDRDAGGGR